MPINETKYIPARDFNDKLSFQKSGDTAPRYNLWAAKPPVLNFFKFSPDTLKLNETYCIVKNWTDSDTFLDDSPHLLVSGNSNNLYFQGSYLITGWNKLAQVYLGLRMGVYSHTDPDAHGGTVPSTGINNSHFLAKYPETLHFTSDAHDLLAPVHGPSYSLRCAPYSKASFGNVSIADLKLDGPIAVIRDWDQSAEFIKFQGEFLVTGESTNATFRGNYIIDKIEKHRADSFTYESHLLIFLKGK